MVSREQAIWDLLETIPDPEVPVLSVVDLGVVRRVSVEASPTDEAVTIHITPTYSGCPALDMIAMGIRIALLEAGYKQINIVQQLSPAWTTDWMSKTGKQKLKDYGIAPPLSNQIVDELFGEEQKIQCPQCNSINTELVSQFGSTSCKALYRCLDCKEPFDYFKCHR
ncbi:MAG: phenylacetate-CoA oxygenase subunit PaaJ [Phycisphaerales bacterium]|nr:phenylacetate-CoA oxygenase subunit PaaJ [Phycisphaerales bacterium]